MRTRLHEQVGRYIEETFPHRLAQFADTLAYHYGRTRRADKQRVWFRAAADAARDAFANQTAIATYQRLLPLLEGPASGHVLLELGAVWQLVGCWDDAQKAYPGPAHRSGRRRPLAAGRWWPGAGRPVHLHQVVRRGPVAHPGRRDLRGDRRGLSRAWTGWPTP